MRAKGCTSHQTHKGGFCAGLLSRCAGRFICFSKSFRRGPGPAEIGEEEYNGGAEPDASRREGGVANDTAR